MQSTEIVHASKINDRPNGPSFFTQQPKQRGLVSELLHHGIATGRRAVRRKVTEDCAVAAFDEALALRTVAVVRLRRRLTVDVPAAVDKPPGPVLRREWRGECSGGGTSNDSSNGEQLNHPRHDSFSCLLRVIGAITDALE